MSTRTKPKYEIVDINHVEVTVDVSLLQKSHDLFFNANQIAKQFDKKANDFLRLESTQEYISLILNESGSGNSRFDNLVKTQKGGKHQGTWLHKELAFEFFGWCSAAFRRAMHKWVEKRLNEEHQHKQNRLALKTEFLPLTNAILHAHTEIKPYHFSNECDLINRLVTGMTAKKFKQAHGVDSVRDALTVAESQLMDKLQVHNTSLIELGFNYEARKDLLQNQANQFFSAIESAT
jgi:hypothetical protein